MADFTFNVALGRVAEYAARVNANDPTNSAFVVVAINANGVTDATMKDLDTLSAVLATAVNEVTNTNYARKVLDQTAGITITVDDTNDRVDVDIPDQTWSDVAAGDAWTDLLVCYDADTTTGDDTNVVPLTCHDFPLTPDGSSISAQIATGGFYRAS